MPTAATTLASWIIGIRKVLDQTGCDSAALFRQAGLDHAAADDPEARYPTEKTRRLWQLAAAATGDPCLGLKVASLARPTSFHALGYAIAASTTLKEGFERALRYYRIVSDAGDLQFHRRGEEYHLVLSAPAVREAPESIDALMSLFVRMCRSRAGRDFSPLRIELCRAEPADRAGFERILRAPLVFDAPVNRLVFSRESMEQRLEGANPELARHNDAVTLRYLARVERENVVLRVQSALSTQLSLGEPSAEKVAQLLHLSPRSLQRKLADAGTSYRQVLDDTRRELALAYLADRRHSISQITFLLGFSDTRSFSRAFRRWTGQAPSLYQPEVGGSAV